MSKVIKLIKSNNLKAANTEFVDNKEVDDAEAEIAALIKAGDSLVASIYQGFINAYEGLETETVPEVLAQRLVLKEKRDASTVHPDHGGDEIFLKYRLTERVEGEHDLYAGVPRYNADKIVKAVAIRKVWFAKIAQAQKDGEMQSKLLPNAYLSHANWFTRYARQQIKSCFSDQESKDYYTDDMPMPSAADDYKATRKTAPKK